MYARGFPLGETPCKIEEIVAEVGMDLARWQEGMLDSLQAACKKHVIEKEEFLESLEGHRITDKGEILGIQMREHRMDMLKLVEDMTWLRLINGKVVDLRKLPKEVEVLDV